MTIAQALKKYSSIEIDLLLAHVLKQPKEFLYLHPQIKLSLTQLHSLQSMANKRLSGIPIAYLLGYKYFYDLKLKVNRKVLIPRPESEWIVEHSLKLINSVSLRSKRVINIIDIGTGSGCIAIAIAKNTTNKKVALTATDISTDALKVAKYNAKTHRVKIKFKKSDLLKNIKGIYDIIVANLPYVPISDYQKFKSNLKHEPIKALTDGTDEFVLVKKLIGQSVKNLTPNGYLILETDPLSIKLLTAKLKSVKKQFKMSVVKDIHGLDRFIIAH